MSREYAHGRAHEEYEIFQDHRRLVAETEGMRQLEQAVREAGETKSKPREGKERGRK
jgi:hypothetical protein